MLQPPPAAGEPAGEGVCPPGGRRQTFSPQGEEDLSSHTLAVFSFFNFFSFFILCRFSEEELESTPYSLGAGTPCQNGLKNQQILSQIVLMKMKYETYFCVMKKENLTKTVIDKFSVTQD